MQHWRMWNNKERYNYQSRSLWPWKFFNRQDLYSKERILGSSSLQVCIRNLVQAKVTNTTIHVRGDLVNFKKLSLPPQCDEMLLESFNLKKITLPVYITEIVRTLHCQSLVFKIHWKDFVILPFSPYNTVLLSSSCNFLDTSYFKK